jgi:hypothetical protein
MTIPSRLTTLSGLAAMIVAGLLLAASNIATAGTVRDHRNDDDKGPGHKGEGGVSVNGQSTKATKAPDVNLKGIDKGKSNTYILRDHR